MKVKLKFRLCLVALVACSSLPALRASAAAYKAIDLYTLGKPPGIFTAFLNYTSEPNGALVGEGTTLGHDHALLWDAAHPSGVDLNPSFLGSNSRSAAYGAAGNQQVGFGSDGNPSSGGGAIIWTGTAASAVSINPNLFGSFTNSWAIGTNGTQQVGAGTGPSLMSPPTGAHSHALLWHGTAASAVDLHPSFFTADSDSEAWATDGTHQVGDGTYGNGTTSTRAHALLWKGTAGSAVDLHPAFLGPDSASNAYGISGAQEVGSGFSSPLAAFPHALLWTGTAASAVDLNPAIFSGRSSSEAFGTNGLRQVGYIESDFPSRISHAVVWSGAADSAIDLQTFLPATFTDSYARSIDASGNIFGYAPDASGTRHAIEWVPVPEPSGLLLMMVGALGLLRRDRRQKAKED
jgi:hypothetical protein